MNLEDNLSCFHGVVIKRGVFIVDGVSEMVVNVGDNKSFQAFVGLGEIMVFDGLHPAVNEVKKNSG